jgi:hypothetical protein
MKTVTSLIFTMMICTLVLTATAQNRYLMLEYVRVKPGTTGYPFIGNACDRIQEQQSKDGSVLASTVWEVVNPKSNSPYQYIVASVFNNFNDYMAEYKSADSSTFFSISKDRFDSVSVKKGDSFEVVYGVMYEILAEAGSSRQMPTYLLSTNIKAAAGRGFAYESMELSDWLPIHEDLIKKGYENAFNFSRLIFPPQLGAYYNYCTFRFFDDEAMFDKQDDIDYEPYMRSNQNAFINSNSLRREVNSELLRLVAVLENGGNNSNATSKNNKNRK